MWQQRNYYVRIGSNDYSVHAKAIGRFVDATRRARNRHEQFGRPIRRTHR
ncbi:Mu transposase domain-containing protein [Arthrobacter sp. UNC362MFTsu5.1]